jgi:hypothetical protein
MAIHLTCPICKQSRAVSTDMPGQSLACPHCYPPEAAIAESTLPPLLIPEEHRTPVVVGTLAESPSSASANEVIAEGITDIPFVVPVQMPRPARRTPAPSVDPGETITLKLRVLADPVRLGSEILDAELTSVGLVLQGRAGNLVIIFGSDVESRGALLRLPWQDHVVEVKLIQPGVDQVRMACDLAAYLRGERRRFHIDDYRLGVVLPILALLPLICPLASLTVLALSRDPWTEHLKLLGWSALCLAVTGGLLFWARYEVPSVVKRVLWSLLLGLFCNGVPVVAVVWGLSWWVSLRPIPDSRWKEFTDPNKMFCVQFPGNAQERLVPVEGDPGLNRKLYVVDLKAMAYIVSVIEIPRHQMKFITMEQRFKGVRDGMLQSKPGSKLISEQPITHDGNTGRELVLHFPKEGNLVVRLIAVDTHMYLLIAGGQKYHAQTPDVQRFFRSFRVLPPAAGNIPHRLAGQSTRPGVVVRML